MSGEPTTTPVAEAIAQLHEAAAAKKCWPCGCLHKTLAAIEESFADAQQPLELREVMRAARERLAPVRYDCLGCDICYPALAINALNQAGGGGGADLQTCPAERLEAREGWPPLPGTYTVLRYRAPVAVCTLTDEKLALATAQQADPELAIVGVLQTENLGIERLIQNVLANPNIRFLIVCGTDSRQAVGHLPGQSLVALARTGLDEHSRIIGARGKRPVLRNVSREAVEHFRRTVEVVDLVGNAELPSVLDALRSCAERNPGAAELLGAARLMTPTAGYVPERMLPDPAGYFVIYVDRPRGLLSLEHYCKEGLLDALIEGRAAAELYTPAIENGLVSRLDHAAYLGRELARAEEALRSGTTYVQDAAPEAERGMGVSHRADGSTCMEITS